MDKLKYILSCLPRFTLSDSSLIASKLKVAPRNGDIKLKSYVEAGSSKVARSKLNFCCYILFAFLAQFFVIISQTSTTFAVSPSFGNQEVKDISNDWNFRVNNANHDYLDPSHELYDYVKNVGDINAVDYSSDGQVLEITYWLTRAFEKSPDKHLPLYAVNLDVDSNPNTGGSLGIDYRVRVQWNNLTKLWENVVEKVAPDESVRIVYYNKNYSVLNQNNSYPLADKSTNSWFPSDCCNYIHFTIDLGLFGHPEKYGLNFFMNDEFSLSNGRKIFAEDSTYDVRVPPPKFEMVAIPDKIELRPNEPKTIEIRLNSSFSFDTRVHMESDASKEIQMQPEQSVIPLPANGIVNTRLTVTALSSADKEAVQDLYLPNLNALVYYPSFNEYGDVYFEPVEEDIPNQKISIPIEVIVDPPLGVDQYFTKFWSVYGDAITLVAGGFTGGFAGWVFARLEMRKKKEAPVEDNY